MLDLLSKKNVTLFVFASLICAQIILYMQNTHANKTVKASPKAVLNEEELGALKNLKKRISELEGKVDFYGEKEKKAKGNSHYDKENNLRGINKTMDLLSKKIASLEEHMYSLADNDDIFQDTSITEEELDILNQERVTQTRELYAETIASQPVDPSWSSSTEAHVFEALSNASDKIRAEHVECKSSLCLVNIARSENTSDDDALDAFETYIDWPGEMTLTYNPNTGRGVAYLAKVGKQLPSLNN